MTRFKPCIPAIASFHRLRRYQDRCSACQKHLQQLHGTRLPGGLKVLDDGLTSLSTTASKRNILRRGANCNASLKPIPSLPIRHSLIRWCLMSNNNSGIGRTLTSRNPETYFSTVTRPYTVVVSSVVKPSRRQRCY